MLTSFALSASDSFSGRCTNWQTLGQLIIPLFYGERNDQVSANWQSFSTLLGSISQGFSSVHIRDCIGLFTTGWRWGGGNQRTVTEELPLWFARRLLDSVRQKLQVSLMLNSVQLELGQWF